MKKLIFGLYLGYILFFLILFLIELVRHSGSVGIHFLDVGQGDAILITTPNNKKFLIDGGPSYDLSINFLSFPRKCHLDAILLTHPHADHLVGITRLLKYCDVDVIYTNPSFYDSKLYGDFIKLLDEKNIYIEEIYLGDVIYFDKVTFHILWPPKNFSSSDSNLNKSSISVLLKYGTYEALFTGDFEISKFEIGSKNYENFLNNLSKNIHENLEILKVPHHGSDKSLDQNFLSKFLIEDAIISVGKNNKYNLPAEALVRLLENNHIKTTRTDHVGDIHFVWTLPVN